MRVEELEASLEEVLGQGYRESLLAKGQSRAMIMRDGVLPEGHPHYPIALSYNLLSYGYGLLSLALQLSDTRGDRNLARRGFEQAGNAIEAAIAKGDRQHAEYGFHITVAACAFHLGRFSARAFSILKLLQGEPNTSPAEKVLTLLMSRSIDELQKEVVSWSATDRASDENITARLREGFRQPDAVEGDGGEDAAEEGDGEDAPHILAIDTALTGNFIGALGTFLLSIETGSAELFDDCFEQLQEGLEISSEINLVTQWWSHRLAMSLLDDLWDTSFHAVLPLLAKEDASKWNDVRSLFIASLYRRPRAEIELWPSQMDAAKRSIDESDNLIASLPTSAGKTRIAELAILRCLAGDRRVIFITPLRALSAQTEVSLHKTFAPLGYKISTLYGSIGSSRYEEDALKESDIVVATPEKIDFALRNDPDILDDIGLVVLDEGHMIGLSEREIRYETQIQRLLRRPDANLRRIVCLSAILPDGDEFEDFVSWLRRDEAGEAIVSDWRPTRVRFGEVQWQANNERAWLEMKIDDERSFVPTYFSAVPPQTARRKKDFPDNQHELIIATTWKLLSEGHSVLIFCPIKKSVEPYAKRIIKAHKQGFIEPLLDEHDPSIRLALAAGAEWLGKDHPILQCLKLGIAVHHGSLPTPFRREIEKLLQAGVLRVTVSSPTLAQGLNLSATAILFHSLHRFGEFIKASEFKNVIGRAGRAFVDVEGLVLYPMFDKVPKRKGDWAHLISEAKGLSLESGLVRLVITLVLRIRTSLGKGTSIDELIEYVVNTAEVWEFPNVSDEPEEQRQKAESDWLKYITFLDTSLLSLLGENDIPLAELSDALDQILSSSLWERRLQRRAENVQQLLSTTLKKRANVIWHSTTSAQRRGYFLAGVGLATGQQLDDIAEEANELLVNFNIAIQQGAGDEAIAACTQIAEILFEIPPFVPNYLPENWRALLQGWLSGQMVHEFAPDSSQQILGFIEDAFVYRLPWGMEAIKVRAQANEDRIGDFHIDDFGMTLAVPAIETGTLNVSAAILMQSGFTSRLAAISAVTSTDATFTDSGGLKMWIASDEVQELSEGGNWPTAETEPLWADFVQKFSRQKKSIWKKQQFVGNPVWNDNAEIRDETYIRLHVEDDGRNSLLSKTYQPLGELTERFPANLSGLLISNINHESGKIDFTYYGEDFDE